MSHDRFTAEMFEALPAYCQGKVLSIEEFLQLEHSDGRFRNTVIDINEVGAEGRPQAKFYVTNHIFGVGVLPKNFVPCTTHLPYHIEPRKHFESGVIANHADYHRFHCHGEPKDQFIESFDELLAYLNQHY